MISSRVTFGVDGAGAGVEIGASAENEGAGAKVGVGCGVVDGGVGDALTLKRSGDGCIVELLSLAGGSNEDDGPNVNFDADVD